ncbi:hypothetical protein M8818_001812 [Zalaria obscura]|uniref:Uncharacterized protein n=1 Tax=Zalaria obscura TaxID=2024903 RepID=A0ACC3SK08_9PEZI
MAARPNGSRMLQAGLHGGLPIACELPAIRDLALGQPHALQRDSSRHPTRHAVSTDVLFFQSAITFSTDILAPILLLQTVCCSRELRIIASTAHACREWLAVALVAKAEPVHDGFGAKANFP